MAKAPVTTDEPAIVAQLSPKQFWGLFASALGVCIPVILGLVGIIYLGLKDDIKDVKDDVKKLNDRFQDATKSAISVQDLLAKAPNLEATIVATQLGVRGLEASVPPQLQAVKDGVDRIERQTGEIRQGLARVQEQTSNLQAEVRRIPGMPR